MTIGASVLDEQNPNWRAAATGSGVSLFDELPQQGQQVEPLRPALPSLLRAAVSHHRSSSNDAASEKRSSHHHPHRILLLQSVRDHSLAMDLAISLASGEPCRCFGGGSRPGSSGSHGSWRSANDGVGVGHASVAAGCQNCVAVSLIVPATTSTTSNHGSAQSEEDSFPMFCRQVQTDDNGAGVSTVMSQQHLTLNLTEQRREASFQAQQQQALHRIQIRHVSSLQDVWDYLLRVPGLPVDQQPVGGILLCGLDSLVQQHHDAAVATIRMTQTGVYLLSMLVILWAFPLTLVHLLLLLAYYYCSCHFDGFGGLLEANARSPCDCGCDPVDKPARERQHWYLCRQQKQQRRGLVSRRLQLLVAHHFARAAQ